MQEDLVMKRKMVSVWLCLSMAAVLLTGCKGSGATADTTAADTGTTKAENMGKPVEISYAVWDSGQANLLRKVADDFEKENPNIKIDIQVSGWDDYWTGLEAAATGGSLPDTFWMHSNNIYYYASNDQLLDLTKYIGQSSEVSMDDYPEELGEIYNLDGKQYAIPKDYDTIALWYNKTMFDEAGIAYPDDTWTWDTLKDAAKKLTKPDKSQYGMCAGLHNQEGFYNFVYQNGGTIVTPDHKSGYSDPKTIGGVEEYFSFVKEGLSPEIYDDKARAEAIENGQCAMGLFGSWNLSGFAANEYMSENFDCAVLPSSNDGKRATIINGLGNAIAKTTKHPDEAWKWVEYLSSKEGQEKQAQLGVAISAYNGTSDAWTKAYPQFNVKCFIDMVDYAQIRPYTHQTSVWEDKANEILKDAYAGKVDVKTACNHVAAMMDEAIAAEN